MPSQGLTKMQGLGLGKQPETIKIPTTETYAVPKKQKPLLSGEIKKEPESYRNVMVETKFVKKQEEKSLLDEQIKQEPEICRSLTACTHSVKQEKTSFFNQQIKNDTEVSNKITETYSSNQHQKSWIDFVNKKIKEEAEASKPNAQNIYSLIQEKKPWLKNSFSSEFDKFLLYKKDPSLIPKPIPEPVKPKMSIEERLKNRCAVYYAGFELCARVRPRENKRTGLSNQQILFRQKILNSPSIRPKRPCDDIHQNTFKIVKHNEKVLLDRLRTCDIEEDTYPLNEKIVEWQYNQLKRYWQYNIYATRSKIHGTGLFAARRLQKCCMIIEYIGEIIRSEVAECRERKNLMKNRLTYMFRLDEDRVVDAMYHGSLARYINHSCDPNCFAEIIELKGDLRIILFAKRDIYENEELTYDYRLDKEDESQKIACLCKSSKCRKYMN
ncbi:unnamed protein product [Acanthoscelides obtectus]|nr:unnamed protein product [Acanthoscelides obtectus]CAK1621398.1 Histone-lysine N-methyltransferase trr [Acanthoscelides obtectus]